MENNRFKDWFINNAIFLIIGLIAIAYLFTALFKFIETGKTIGEVLLSSALIFIMAYSVSTLFDIQGIFKGGKTKEVIDIKNEHEKTVILVEPHANKLDDFCLEESNENLKQTRIRFLAKAGLDYKTCFNENGSAKDVSSLEMFKLPEKPKRDKTKIKNENKLIRQEYRFKVQDVKFKKAMFKKAVGVNLTQLTTQSLISNGSNTNDKFDFGDTQVDYFRKSNIFNFGSKLLFGLTLGLITIDLIDNFSWLLLIWTGLQIVIFLAFGIIKYFQAYLFMQNNFVERVKRQVSYLKKFLNKEKAITSETYIDEIAEKVAKKFEVS